MALHYLDTSALAKRDVPERGSQWITALLVSETAAVSELIIVEMGSTLARRTREGGLTARQRDTNFELFLQDMQVYTVLEQPRSLIRVAATLLLADPPLPRLRSLDALHIASARAAFAEAIRNGTVVGTFVSSDIALLAAARSTGLAVANPENYP
ncbi:MAG: type II toxin-antitoxin system VapC family toxin [Dehalococcoidia bacterium]